MKSKTTMIRKALLYSIPFGIFAAFALYVLLGQYPDVLYTAQDRNEFFSTGMFFSDKMHAPFGLMNYLGCYFTQYFYHPAVGVILLLLMWGIIYALWVTMMRKTTPKVTPVYASLALLPIGCLLVSLTDVGYWIYAMPIRGYWFAETLAYLCVSLMLWGASCTSRRWQNLWYVSAILTFPLLGVWSWFFALCLFVMQVADGSDARSPWWQRVLGLALAVASPWVVWIHVYEGINVGKALKAGLPYFDASNASSFTQTWPFVALAVFSLVMLMLKKYVKEIGKWKSVALCAAVAGIIVLGNLKLAFSDYNYRAEMRMNRAAMDDDWQSIIDEATKAEEPSRTMVVLKDIALINTGQLGNLSFNLGCNGKDIYNPDSLQVNIMQIAAPLVYYNYGKLQFATRWAMENSVQNGFSPYNLKVFIRAAQESGEPRLVDRYLHLLSHTRNHADWRPQPTTPLVRDLKESFSDVIDADHDNCERYLIENFSYAALVGEQALQKLSHEVHEVILHHAMLYRDPRQFWYSFYIYTSATQGKNLPLHYQEAYLVMQENYPQQLPFEVQISPALRNTYNAYAKAVMMCNQQGMSYEETGKALQEEWKHTYWWHLMYGRKVY